MVLSNDYSLDRENAILILPQQDYIYDKFDVLGELYSSFLKLQTIYMKQILFLLLLLYLKNFVVKILLVTVVKFKYFKEATGIFADI